VGPADRFIQRDPDNGREATERTELRFAYDARYLYVAVTCSDSAADAIATGLGRRDQFPATDFVGIGLDPRHDHLTAYQFETNPSAVQRDFSISDDDRFDFDYDAVWDLSRGPIRAAPGVFSPLRDIGDTAFGAEANHVLIVKVSYWLNR